MDFWLPWARSFPCWSAVRTARLLSLDTDKVWSVALLAIVTGLVGSRILLILLHWPRYGARALT